MVVMSDKTFKIGNIDDIRRIEQIPHQERFTEKSTFELLEKGAAVNPHAPAIIYIEDGEKYDHAITISYQQFIEKVRQTANMFNALGAGPDDIITYILPNLPQTHYVLWGAEAAGIVNPVNPLLEPAAIADICNTLNTKIIVTNPEFLPKIETIRNQLPALEHVIISGGNARLHDDIDYEREVIKYDSAGLSFDRTIQPDDIASIYHTGGTTGTPKLTKRTHYNEIFISYCLMMVLDLHSCEGTLLSGLPLFHCNATMITGIAPLSIGKSVTLLTSSGYRNPAIIENFYKIVSKYKAFMFTAVPTVLSALINIPVDGDISSLQYTCCGSAPLSVELFNRFEKHTNIRILEGYGLTESTVASSVNPKDGKRKIGSIGIRMPYIDLKIKIIDDHGNFIRDAEPDEIGNICIKGPNIFTGYVKKGHNRGIWADGYFNSGDLGRIDEDGYIWITGRKKDLIIRGGHNIDPGSIEESLYKLNGIQAVAAVGQPDEHAGEIPIAYVQTSENSNLSEPAILQWAEKSISERAAIPKEIIIMDEIPLTAVGKIFKPALRYDAIQRAYERKLHALYDEELVASFYVDAQEDDVHGTKARVVVTPIVNDETVIKERTAELLMHYSVPYEIIESKI
jgi:fatty-acyl-CoA synthase